MKSYFRTEKERLALIVENSDILRAEHGNGIQGWLEYLTAEEYQAKIDAEWPQRMAESDKTMPRWAEDLFDLCTGAKTIEDIPELVKKVADKKALRGGKP